MSQDTINYIIMLVFSTGLGGWLTDRLVRSRADARQAERTRVNQTLTFLEGITRAREALKESGASPDKLKAYDAMRERLSVEAGQLVAELNLDAVDELERPSSRYVLAPPPLTGFGFLATLTFAASVIVALFFWLTLAFYLWSGDIKPDLVDPNSQWNAIKLLAPGLGLIAFGLLARWAAFKDHDAASARRRARAAEALA